MTVENFLERYFDDLLFQTHRGNLTHAQLDAGRRYDQFVQVKEWKSKYGYRFSIYSNDHFINGKAHFHFDNVSENMYSKFDFEGSLLEFKGSKSMPKKVLDDLKYFLKKDGVQKALIEYWNKCNPEMRI